MFCNTLNLIAVEMSLDQRPCIKRSLSNRSQMRMGVSGYQNKSLVRAQSCKTTPLNHVVPIAYVVPQENQKVIFRSISVPRRTESYMQAIEERRSSSKLENEQMAEKEIKISSPETKSRSVTGFVSSFLARVPKRSNSIKK